MRIIHARAYCNQCAFADQGKLARAILASAKEHSAKTHHSVDAIVETRYKIRAADVEKKP